MIAEDVVRLHIVDDYRVAVLPDLIADGRLDTEFSARREAKGDAVPNGAADPLIRSHARDGDEAHARNTCGQIQDLGNRPDLLDGIDVRLDVNCHGEP